MDGFCRISHRLSNQQLGLSSFQGVLFLVVFKGHQKEHHHFSGSPLKRRRKKNTSRPMKPPRLAEPRGARGSRSAALLEDGRAQCRSSAKTHRRCVVCIGRQGVPCPRSAPFLQLGCNWALWSFCVLGGAKKAAKKDGLKHRETRILLWEWSGELRVWFLLLEGFNLPGEDHEARPILAKAGRARSFCP